MKKNILNYIFIITLSMFSQVSYASEITWNINTSWNSTLNLSIPCWTPTVSNWTVNSTTCAITCNSWFFLSWNSCIVNPVVCEISTVSNWTVNSTTCAITCNSWFSKSWNTCVANSTWWGGSSWGGGWWSSGWSNSTPIILTPPKQPTNDNSSSSSWSNSPKLDTFKVEETFEASSNETTENSSWTCNSSTISRKITFTDIDNSFAKKYIEELASKWIVNGYWDNTFRPENLATRVEFLKMILLSKSINYCETDLSNIWFDDVNKSGWEARIISKAISLGYIDVNNKTFRPTDTITRAEAIKLIIKAIWTEVAETEAIVFTDVVDTWMKKYINKALELNIISSGDKFRPLDSITRAEVAKIVYNSFLK